MQKRRNVWAAGLIAAGALACGEAAGGVAGRAMRDAGAVLEDAGRAMGGDGGAGGRATDTTDGVMADAGRAIADAGRAVRDAGGALVDAVSGGRGGMAAAEPTVLKVQCDIRSGRIETNDSTGAWTERADYYAEVTAPPGSREDRAGASALLCDWQDIGTPPPYTAPCPPGHTCSRLGPELPVHSECSTSPVTLDGDVLRVWCGSSVHAKGSTENGGRWSSAIFMVPGG